MSDQGESRHIFRRLDTELARLNQRVLDMGGMVLRQMEDALASLKTGDKASAQRVISLEAEVNRMEVDTDAMILTMIALDSPLGPDLRTALTVSKSVTELEKIGDEAARMAGLLIESRAHSCQPLDEHLALEIDRLAGASLNPLRAAIGLFDVWDETVAQSIIEGYRQVEDEFRTQLARLMTRIQDGQLPVDDAVDLIFVAKSLERVAHHAVNLADYAFFERMGLDLRHTAR